MKRAILFSTGNTYRLYSSTHEQIGACMKLDADGIEIIFPTRKKLMDFHFNKNELIVFKKLKYKTIHFPFYKNMEKEEFYLYDNKGCRKALEKIYSLSKQIGAQNINVHAHQIKNIKVFDGLDDINYTIENLTERHGFRINDYKIILKKYPNFDMLLDVSHGIRTNLLERLFKTFKDRIRFIHLSIAKGPGMGNDHFMLHRFDQNKIKRLNIIKKLKCPIIIEAGQEKDLTMKDFKKEIKYVRRWLNS